MSKTIRLTATGETITFLEDTRKTNGERLLLAVSLPEAGKGPGLHVHHQQTESFEVVTGVLGVQRGDERLELKAGEHTVIPAGTVHDWWNAGEEPVHLRAVVEPALNTEWMLREIFASCNRRQAAQPSPWDGSYVITQLKGEYALADVPVPVQRLVFPVVAAAGKLLGQVKASPRTEPTVS